MKKILFLVVFLLVFSGLFSQKVSGLVYGYDGCGNRISRVPNQITLSRSNSSGSGVYFDSLYSESLCLVVSNDLNTLSFEGSEELYSKGMTYSIYDSNGFAICEKQSALIEDRVCLSTYLKGRYCIELQVGEKHSKWDLAIN